MTKFDGSQVAVGFGLESTRGTAVAVAYWDSRLELGFVDKVENDYDEAVRGVIADNVGSVLVKEWAEGPIKGNVKINGIGYLLYALFGAVSTASTGGAYAHTFSVDMDSNSHKSLTIVVKDPNSDYKYPLAMIESAELSIENGKRATFSVNVKSKKKAAATSTVAYPATEYPLLAKHATFKVAADKASLGAASGRCLQSLTLRFTKNLVEIPCISMTEPNDILNTTFTVEGTLEAIYDNETDYRNDALAGSVKALGLYIQDTNTTIGSSENPGLDITLNQVVFSEWSPTYQRGDIVKQTVQFKAQYCLDDAEMIEAILTNTTASY